MSVNVKAERGQVKILRLCVTFLTLPLFNVKNYAGKNYATVEIHLDITLSMDMLRRSLSHSLLLHTLLYFLARFLQPPNCYETCSLIWASDTLNLSG